MNQHEMMQAMQSGNTDRLVLRMAIVGHRTFACPLTKEILDVDRSFMIEATHADGRNEHIGPFNKSIYKASNLDAVTWFRCFLENLGKRLPDDIQLREIKG